MNGGDLWERVASEPPQPDRTAADLTGGVLAGLPKNACGKVQQKRRAQSANAPVLEHDSSNTKGSASNATEWIRRLLQL